MCRSSSPKSCATAPPPTTTFKASASTLPGQTGGFSKAAIGVARIHDRRLLHTDIKPANLFLDADNHVLVGDLGLDSRMDAAGTGHPAGSVETMAPEVGLGLRTTVRSDVYSLGSCLYQLLTGDWGTWAT